MNQPDLKRRINQFSVLFNGFVLAFVGAGIILAFLLRISDWFLFFLQIPLLLEQTMQGSIRFAFIAFYIITYVGIFLASKFGHRLRDTLTGEIQWPRSKAILTISVLLAIFLMSERYLRYSLPTGGDTPLYMVEIERVSRKGVDLEWLSRSTPTRMFTLIFYPLIVLNIPSEVIIKLIPSLIGVFYVLATYYLAREFDVKIASLASFVAAASFCIITLSSQLYANFLAMGLMALFFLYYLKATTTRKTKHVVIASLLQFLLLQIYGPSWLLSAGVVLLSLLIAFLRKNNRKQLMRVTLEIYVPSILVIATGLLIGPLFHGMWNYGMWIGYYTYGLGISLGNAASFFPAIVYQDKGSYDLQPFLLESAIILVMADIGYVIWLAKRSKFRDFALAWTLVPSLLMPFFYSARYRLALYYPFPVLAAVGLYFFLSRTAKLPLKSANTPRVNLHLVSIVFIILMCSSIIRTTQSPLIYPSASNYADELYWIRDNYDPRTTIVAIGDYVHNPPTIYDSDVAWVQVITKAYIYIGNISSLLSGTIPEVEYTWVNLPGEKVINELAHFTVLVLSRESFPRFYILSKSELSVLEKVHESIYVVNKEKYHILLANEAP